MASIIDALKLVASRGWWRGWQSPAWELSVLAGDRKHRKALSDSYHRSWLPPVLLNALAKPDALGLEGWLLRQACQGTNHPGVAGVCTQRNTSAEE